MNGQKYCTGWLVSKIFHYQPQVQDGQYVQQYIPLMVVEWLEGSFMSSHGLVRRICYTVKLAGQMVQSCQPHLFLCRNSITTDRQKIDQDTDNFMGRPGPLLHTECEAHPEKEYLQREIQGPTPAFHPCEKCLQRRNSRDRHQLRSVGFFTQRIFQGPTQPSTFQVPLFMRLLTSKLPTHVLFLQRQQSYRNFTFKKELEKGLRRC